MVVLDTDILSLMEWEESSASNRLHERLTNFPPNEIRTSIISFEEQMRGWMAYIAEAKKMTQEVEAFRRLHRQLKLYCKLTILEFDESAAVRFQSLRKQFRRLKRNDLKIAAVALANQATLVTRNLNDFRQIPGLKVEDWTK
jgi:tRNA(fMet)-specific endonuclease VapC